MSSKANKVFQALSSSSRRQILAYLSNKPLTAGEIAMKFEMSKPAISKHLAILEGAELIQKQKKGQFIHYSLNDTNLVTTLNKYVQQVCPVSRKLKKGE